MQKVNKSNFYNKEFFSLLSEISVKSAKEVIPLILKYFTPQSVVDLGCGTGAWLSIWEKYGVKDVLGIDGDYINESQLLIQKESFMNADLEYTIILTKKFDLAMSLEVAEHIKPEHAGDFIHSLCNMSNVVLFSAAIPHQGGILHYNEQYPDYWIKLFSQNDFSPYDCVRDKIWNNKNVNTCYQQNILFFVKNSEQDKYLLITGEKKAVLPLVHPELYELKQRVINDYKQIVKTPFHAGWFFFKKYCKLILKGLGLRKNIF
jgi:SAM-dependent methyltransferase